MDPESVPPPFEPMSRRPFAFYPPIRNFEHNEWLYRKATWSEVLVANEKTGTEVWIPRRYLGQVSSIDEPLMIVGLERELEYKAGSVWPYVRRVLEIPSAGPAAGAVPPQTGSEPPHPHGPSSPAESRIGRLIAAALVAAIALFVIVVAVFRIGAPRPIHFTALDQDFLSLSRTDDYFAVVQKLGRPAEDRWRSETGELQYRALWYPQRSYFVILLGADRSHLRYIGALDRNWRVIHYVDLPNGADTAAMLRALDKF